VHWWRGIGRDVQLSLFYFGLRLGFVTISIERDWMLDAYRVLRNAMAERIAGDREGR